MKAYEIKGVLKREELKNYIINTIKRDKLRYQDPILSENQLVEKCRISRDTVRRAISELVDERILYRIHGKGTFVGQVKPAPKKTITIGIIALYNEDLLRKEISLEVPQLVHFREWTDFLTLKALEINSILIGIPSSLGQDKAKLNNFLKKSKISGIVVLGKGSLTIELLNLIKQEKIPHIVFIDPVNIKNINFITFNNYSGAFKAAQYLVNKGHKKIAIIIGDQAYYGFRERLKGYKDGLIQGGIEEKDISISYCEQGEVKSGYDVTRELLSKEVIPTAILSCSDFATFGAINAIKEKGIKIPEEIAIVGYDDLSFSSKGDLPLTTVRIPREKMVEEGLRVLIDLVLQKEVSPDRLKQEIEPELMIRKTA